MFGTDVKHVIVYMTTFIRQKCQTTLSLEWNPSNRLATIHQRYRQPRIDPVVLDIQISPALRNRRAQSVVRLWVHKSRANGPKSGRSCCAPFSGGAADGSPCNRMSPGPRRTSVPSDILKAKFHYAIWFEPVSNQLRTASVIEFGFNPSNRFATVHQRYRQDRQTTVR